MNLARAQILAVFSPSGKSVPFQRVLPVFLGLAGKGHCHRSVQLHNTGGGAWGRTGAVAKGSPTGHCALAGDVTKGLVEDNFWCPVPVPLFYVRDHRIPIVSP